ncbi:MAG: hypothetical protein ACFE0Q_20085 [Anaerolineae bacterium]
MKKQLIVISILIIVLSAFAGLSFAQDDSTVPTQNRFRERVLFDEIVTLITEQTGLEATDIVQQWRDGATLAEIISENGGDVDAVIAEASDLFSTHLESLLNSEFPFMSNGFFDGERGAMLRERLQNGFFGELATIVTDETGLSNLEIMEQLRDGATLAEIISENGGDVDAVIAETVASVTEFVNTQVEAERITQAQADQALENLESTLTDWVNGEAPLRRFGDPRNGNPGRGERGQ